MSMGDDLLAIIKSEREIRQRHDAEPIVDCPICGETLDKNSRGAYSCPLGHYRAAAGTTKGMV